MGRGEDHGTRATRGVFGGGGGGLGGFGEGFGGLWGGFGLWVCLGGLVGQRRWLVVFITPDASGLGPRWNGATAHRFNFFAFTWKIDFTFSL